MGSNANPVPLPVETPVVFELTLSPAGSVGSDTRRKKTFALDRTLRIGADPANHIVVDGEGVGAFHARFFPGAVAPLIVLSGSSASINGLEVRGSAGLVSGDVLSIGRYELRVSVRGAQNDRSASPSAKWQLVLDDDVASVQVAADVVIGSEAGCGLHLPDTDVKPRHAQLVLRGAALWLRDLSGGATFVNEQAVNGACPLEPDDLLRIGQHRFRAVRQTVSMAAPVAAKPTPQPSVDLPPKVSTAQIIAEVPPPTPKKPPARVAELTWEEDDLGLPVAPLRFELVEPELVEPERVEPEVVRVVPRASPPVPRATPPVSRATPPRVPPAAETPVVAADRRVVSPRVEARVSRKSSVRPRSKKRSTGRTVLWRITLLALMTLAWALAIRPPAYDAVLDQVFGGWTAAELFDRAGAEARRLQTAIADRYVEYRAKLASQTATPAIDPLAHDERTPVSASATNVGAAQATPDIAELQRSAASGDAAAIARLKELADFYSELAASAMERGDKAVAQRHLAMVVLMRSTFTDAEGKAAVQTQVVPSQKVPSQSAPAQGVPSRADALAQEARELQSRGAVFAPPQRNVVRVLVEALTLDPGHQEARRHLNLVMGSLSGRITTLIANHQFRDAGSLLEQLADDGIPVLSNGNVRDRPSFLEPQHWQSLAILSLLVEADALIQRGLIATAGEENAISLLESATRLDRSNPLIQDMRAKSSGLLTLAAREAAERGMSEEAARLANLATYVRDGFGT